MKNLEQIRDAIAEQIKAALPSLKTCEGHGGRFDQAELKRVSAKSPAVHIAILKVTDITKDGDAEGTVHFACYVTTRSRGANDKESLALSVAQALLVLIPNNDWGLDETIQIPFRISSQNLYGATIDKMGIAMWGITFQQRMNFGGAPDLNELNDFITYHAEHSLVDGNDEPQAIDEVTLEQ